MRLTHCGVQQTRVFGGGRRSIGRGATSCEIFYSLAEARVLIKVGCQHDNSVRPHRSLGNQPLGRKRRHRHCRPPVPLRFASARQWRRRRQCTNYLPGPPGEGPLRELLPLQRDGGRQGMRERRLALERQRRVMGAPCQQQRNQDIRSGDPALRKSLIAVRSNPGGSEAVQKKPGVAPRERHRL